MATIKGITIEIAGKTSPLVDSLKEADKALKSTNDALKAVNKALELDPSNVDLITQKQELLANAVEATTDRLDALKGAAELAAQGLENGTTSREQYAQLTAEIATTEHGLQQLSDQANNVGGALEDAGDSAIEAGENAEESGQKAENAGSGWDAFGAMAQGAAQAITTYVIDAIVQASEALIDFTEQAVQAYGSAEQLKGGVEKLYGDAADTVIENANNAFSTAGLSANDYMETVTSFSASLISGLGGDTVRAAEIADRAIRDMSDNANTFGRDMDSIMTVYSGLARGTYTTLDNLSLGFAGTQEGMIELINASGIIKGQIESLDDITFDQMILAIHAVQEQMNIVDTTANEAASTVEGSVNSMSAAWDNLVAGMGDSEANINQLINNFVDAAMTAARNIGPVIENVFSNLEILVGEIGPILEELLPQMISGTFSSIVSALSALIVAVVKELPSLLTILTSTIPTLMDTLIPAILEVLPEIVQAGLDIVIALANSLGENAPVLIPMVVQCVSQIVNTLIDNLDELIVAGGELLAGVALGILAAIPDLVAMCNNATAAMWDEFMDFGDTLAESALTWGVDMISNFISGITASMGNLINSVSNVASTVASYLHFSVPDKGPLSDFDESGADMIDVFAQGMLGELDTLEGALTVTGNVINQGMNGAIDYTSALSGLNDSVNSLGNNPTVVNVSIGDEQISNFIVNSNRSYDYVSGGY